MNRCGSASRTARRIAGSSSLLCLRFRLHPAGHFHGGIGLASSSFSPISNINFYFSSFEERDTSIL